MSESERDRQTDRDKENERESTGSPQNKRERVLIYKCQKQKPCIFHRETLHKPKEAQKKVPVMMMTVGEEI